MPKLPGNPLTYTPSGASDTVDGTTAFPGAMRVLTNLIPDPSTRGLWASRPAAHLMAAIPGATGIPSGLLVIGNLVYGMVPGAVPGKDSPFMYNAGTGTFVPVGGIASALLPDSQPSTGDWTPPILAQVGTRVIVTHPGFPGDEIKFGWFDFSSLNIAISGNVTTATGAAYCITGPFSVLGVQPGVQIQGANIPATARVQQTFDNASVGFRSVSNVATGSTTVNVNPIDGFRPGSLLYGTGIPPGATIVSRSAMSGAGTIVMSAPATEIKSGGVIVAVLPTSQVPQVTTTASSTAATWTADGGGSSANYFAVGQSIQNANIPFGTTITAASAGSITLSQPATGSGTAPVIVNGSVILMDTAATGSADGESITLSGGTPTAPLWYAGDCDRNPLPSKPLGVAQFNGRAYYAVGQNGIAFSDPLEPCRRTNANQALLTNDGFEVTAVAPLMLNSVTGGIVQAIIAFEGANQMRQITGDPATGNLAMNLLPVETGTLSPLSIVPTEKGLAFISPDGLRFIDFAGNVSLPIGDFGMGVVVPFHEAVFPSRICGSVQSSVLRFTAQNGAVDGDPFQEWWFDLSLQKWHGPHTFPAALIQRWHNQSIMVPIGISGQLWSSAVVPTSNDNYIENGQYLTCIAETSLLPDNQQLGMNKMVEANLACAGSLQINYQVLDEYDTPMDYVGIPIPSDGSGAFRQRPVRFHRPMLFKQMRTVVSAQADPALRIGNFYWRWEVLPYNIQPAGTLLTYSPGFDGGGDMVATITAVNAGPGLTGGGVAGSVTLSLDIPVSVEHGGTGAVTAAAGLDNLSGASGATVGSLTRSAGGAWSVNPAGTGSVTSVVAGTGLSGGTITTSGTISLATPVSVANGGTGATSLPNISTSFGLSGTFLLGQGTSPVIPASDATGIVGTWGGASIVCQGAGTAGYIDLARQNGTLSSPTTILNNDIIGGIFIDGYAGTGWASQSPAGFNCRALENWTAGAWGSKLDFWTTPVGTATPVTTLSLAGNAATMTGTLLVNHNSAPPPPGQGGDLMVLGANGANAVIDVQAFGTGATPFIIANYARGTAAAPTAAQSGDVLLNIGGTGYAATGWGTFASGALSLQATENFTATAQGSKWVFVTHQTGTTTAVNSLILAGKAATFSGTVGLAGQAVPADALPSALVGASDGLVASSAGATGTSLASNLYLSGSGWKYHVTGAGTLMQAAPLGLSWWSAPSGSGGTAATITQIATLDTGGNYTILGATATKPGGGSWTAPSARELKTDIEPYRASLAELLDLKPVTYRYAPSSGFSDDQTYVGLVHDETSGMPEMHRKARVGSIDDNRETDALDTTALTFALINAVKELSARVDQLSEAVNRR